MAATFRLQLRDPNKESSLVYLVKRYKRGEQTEDIKYNTKEKVLTKYWVNDPDARNYQRVREVGEYPESEDINNQLEYILAKAKSVWSDYVRMNGGVPLASELRNELDAALNRIPSMDTGLLGFLATQIDMYEKEEKSSNNGKVKHGGRYRNYSQTYSALKGYAQSRNKRVDFYDMSLAFYYDFIDYCRNKKGWTVNNTGKHIKNLKAILREAEIKGYDINPEWRHRKFVILKEEVDVIYLTVEELTALHNHKFDSKGLQKATDLFLVGCWTGLRYSDFSRLTTDHVDGDYIHVTTKKTGRRVVIPYHKVVREIFDKYEGQLPTYSNPKLNKYIKEACSKVEELKGKAAEVSTHTARRSFATNMFRLGIPARVIMNVTGHKTESSFRRYIRMTEKDSAELMKGAWDKVF